MLVAEGLRARQVIRVAPVGPVRILVVEDHEVLRSGLSWLLTRVGWVSGCAVASCSAEALVLAAAGEFDVALVDVDLGVESGLAVCGRRGALVPTTGLLSSRWDLVSLRTARGVGARGVIAKDRPARALLASVGELAAGRACEVLPTPGEVRFQPREREILRLVGAGLTNAEIGAELFLAPGTIKHHTLELYEKLEAPNRAAAVHAARRLGVLTDHRAEASSGAPHGARRRVLVADSDDVRRTGLLLALHGGVGARDAEDALALTARLQPEIALAGNAELCRALSAASVPTLLVRDDEGPAAAGAVGVVRQWWTAGRVAAAVAQACEAASPASACAGRRPAASGGGAAARAPAELGRGDSGGAPLVSPREHDVLSALAAGGTNPAIARALGLSTNTVKQHASSIFRKLGARNRAEAVRLADDLGLI